MMTRDQLEQVSEALQDAYMHTEDKEDYQTFRTAYNICGAALAEPSEPVAEVAGDYNTKHIIFLPAGIALEVGDKLFTHPASKPEKLTDEDIFEIAEPFGAFQYGDAQGDKRKDFARAILAAAREKA